MTEFAQWLLDNWPAALLFVVIASAAFGFFSQFFRHIADDAWGHPK